MRICIFKEQAHCKKLGRNLCRYDLLPAEDVLFMGLSYGCYSNNRSEWSFLWGRAGRVLCAPSRPPAAGGPRGQGDVRVLPLNLALRAALHVRAGLLLNSWHEPCLSGISLYLHLRNRNFHFGCSSEILLELVIMDCPSTDSSSI